MSYESTACPCGGKKERETMICDPCKAFASITAANDLALYEDHRIPTATRRAMAIRILAIARRRGSANPK
jgi:hypothetical protein